MLICTDCLEIKWGWIDMSITDAIKDIEKHMGIDSDFSEYMNAPLPHNNQGYVQRDCKTGVLWVHCPFCGKKNLMISDNTVISNLEIKCKGSNCKKTFFVNVRGR